MNTNIDCERARMALMASLDGEAVERSPGDAHHIETCAMCRSWLQEQQAMTAQFRDLPYPRPASDLWTAVESQIHISQPGPSLQPWLWLAGGVVLAWRAFELFVDAPLQVLHPLVPLAVAVIALWLIAKDPLAIETSAPELQNRGV